MQRSILGVVSIFGFMDLLPFSSGLFQFDDLHTVVLLRMLRGGLFREYGNVPLDFMFPEPGPYKRCIVLRVVFLEDRMNAGGKYQLPTDRLRRADPNDPYR